MKKIIFILILSSSTCFANKERDAMEKAGEAFYKQSGLERYVSKFIDKNVNDDLRNWTGNAFLAYKVIQERQIVYTWNF